jgi:CheY-like chemotaxis protein/nitrogen-specific signal transduction histidine kinase/HPt (histidine-containing phosphotransfer) domain-containing protein
MGESLLEIYCSQLGTVLGRRSPGLALITARQQANQRMMEAEASDRAKTKFLANMSHELRTPVNGVLGMLELARHTEFGPKQHHYIETARRSAETLLGIINGILDISKIEAGKIELEESAFDLRDIVEEVTESFAGVADGKGLEMTCLVPANLPTALVGDSGRLRQILTNLIGNAVKFTEKGEVGVRVQVLEVDAGSAYIAFEVTDSGIGIALDKQQYIFDAFIQADSSTTRRYGGTGLGLSIAKQLCEMMGGAIELTSEPGRGSNFRFTARFGRQQEADKPAGTAPRFAAPTVPPEGVAGTRVLLVEDNPVNLEVAVGILESFGCKVETATNGVEALDRYAGRQYGLIFMDCQLPGMDGFEATAAIRKQEAGSDRHVPIVALTASAIEGDREQCLAAGMDDYLPKPFTAGQMRSILANWLSLPQPDPADRDRLDAASPLDPIDTRVLNGLAGLQREGRPDIVNRVITLFLENAPLLLKELETGAANGDLALLHRASHTLKSASANVGAAQLSARCESLEAALRTGSVTDVRSRVQVIVEAYRLVETALTSRLPAVA